MSQDFLSMYRGNFRRCRFGKKYEKGKRKRGNIKENARKGKEREERGKEK
jgi:hypothetical protein